MEKFRFYALWLCLACILVFILQNVFSGFTDLFVLNQSSFTQIWRFASSIFLHANVVHITYNLFALAIFGSILEKVIGSKKFLFVFFVSGIVANVIAVNFYSSSLGASGAIYGILGCLALLKPTMAVFAFGLPMPMFIAAILWVGGSLLGIVMPSNVGDIAHLSGIAVGFLIGLFFRLRRREVRKELKRIQIPESEINEWENRYMKK